MRKILVKISVFLIALLMCSCSSISVNSLRVGKAGKPRSARKIKIFYTNKAVKKPYTIVSRYSLVIRNADLNEGIDELLLKAGEDGCDAVLLKWGAGHKMTIWSWVYLFIPISESLKEFDFIGIRYKAEDGGL